MANTPIDYTDLLRKDLPAAAAKWSGFPRYNFVGGHNDSASVPVEELIAAMTAVMTREGRTLATYNLESGAQGYLPLRQFLVKKLAQDAGMTCSTDDILITSGSLQGLDLVNQVLLERGDTIIGEETTYGGSLTRVAKLGVKWVGAPLDKGGIRMDALDAILSDLKGRGVRPKYIYTIPTVQNPTATVMPMERRLELLRLSEAYGVPIFEDECYADLTWAGERPKALRALAGDNDRVIHIGSFSKNIAPALRIGYLVANWPLMGRILSMKTDAGTGALEQMMLAEYCTKHFDAHVPKLRKALKRKLDVLVETLHAEFGTSAEFDVPEGGIFLWVKLPEQVDTLKLFQAAAKEGVAINPGIEWSSNAELGRTRLRICFANPTEAVIREGVARLADICFREFGVPVRSGNVKRG
ncbi:MAG: PLP-dependent aminotransferase family protein [Hyphomicrobiaceae bacterium]